MKAYSNKEEMMKILSALWSKILLTPEILASVAAQKLIVKFRFTDYISELYIDIAGSPPEFYWDPPNPVRYDVEMILNSETGHKFWMEELNVPLAIASRKIVAKGSIPKALKLLPALKPAFAIYKNVLKENNRDDLLQTDKKVIKAADLHKKQKHKFSFFIFSRKKEKRSYNLNLLPSFPITLSDKEYVVSTEKPAVNNKKTDSKESSTFDAESTKPAINNKQLTLSDLLKTMLTIRLFEEHLSREFQKGNLPTEAIHLSIGQEAVAAGVCMTLRDTDYLNTTHRGHGHIIAKGADIKRMLAEIYGKSTGLCKGLGGSMHVTDRSKGILGANGIVGAGYLLALGAGFTIKYHKKTDDISVVIAGDGSVNQGMFHEALNMIALLELPVLIVIENNLYGEFTSVERHSAMPEIYKRAIAYNIESYRFNGNDAALIFTEVGKIVDKIRFDKRPRLVELMTYRWQGHMEGESETYRNSEEKELYKREDPIARLQSELRNSGISENDINNIKTESELELIEAVEFAEKSEPPKESALYSEIYCPEDSSLYTGAFTLTGDTITMSVSEAINQAIEEEMTRDERVFLWGEDVSLGGYFNVTSGLIEKFGNKRIIDTPISENGFVGGAVGAAITGMKPIVEILFADFLTCCMDPILNQAAKLRQMTGGQVSVPLTIRTPLGSGIGMAAQHSQSMEKFFLGIPGLIVIAPSDAYTCKGLLKSAIRSNNPTLFFEHKLLYAESGNVPVKEYTLPIGKARVVREGSDITIVTYLLGVSIALSVSNILTKYGINAEIIDVLTLYPIDTKTILDSVSKTGYLITIEEALFTGSVCSEVISRVAVAGFNLLKAPPFKIAAPDCPVPYAKNLETSMIPVPEIVAEKIAKFFYN